MGQQLKTRGDIRDKQQVAVARSCSYLPLQDVIACATTSKEFGKLGPFAFLDPTTGKYETFRVSPHSDRGEEFGQCRNLVANALDDGQTLLCISSDGIIHQM